MIMPEVEPKPITNLRVPRMLSNGDEKSMTEIAHQPVTKKAAERAPIEKNASLLSLGSNANIVNAVRPSAGTILGAGAMMAGLMGATTLVGALSDAVKGTLNAKAYDRVFERALAINPKLKAYDHALLKQYFNLIAESSPTVAKNPLLVSNYLQYMLDHEGSMNFMAYKGLVDMEGQMLKNHEAANALQSVSQKALMDGVIRAAIPNVQYKMDLYGPKDSVFGGTH
jgi:hypothetical protein